MEQIPWQIAHCVITLAPRARVPTKTALGICMLVYTYKSMPGARYLSSNVVYAYAIEALNTHTPWRSVVIVPLLVCSIHVRIDCYIPMSIDLMY